MLNTPINHVDAPRRRQMSGRVRRKGCITSETRRIHAAQTALGLVCCAQLTE